MLENTERAKQNGQSRETGNIVYTRRRKTKQYVLNITIRIQTHMMQIRQEPSYKKLEGKTNRTSFLCGIRNGHHNTELRT